MPVLRASGSRARRTAFRSARAALFAGIAIPLAMAGDPEVAFDPGPAPAAAPPPASGSGKEGGGAAEPFHLRKREIETLSKVADFERMLDRHGYVHPGESLRQYVASVGDRLVPADFPDTRLRFRFQVMRSPEANAFALPNGSIYVTVGLIALLENEGQLAAVLAHEVTHSARYHYFRFERQYKAKSMALNLFSVGALAVGGWGGLLAGLGAEALYVGTIFGYSRDLEEEADRMGLTALEAADYDVAQMPASFRRLMVDYEGLHLDTPVFYSSHPKLKARAEYTQEQIERDRLAPDPARAFPDRYVQPRDEAARDVVRLAIVNGLPRTALANAEHVAGRHPGSAEARYLRAEALRALGHIPADPGPEPPGDSEKKRLLREKRERTPEEIEADMAKTDEGRAAWSANAAAAEREYRRALELDPGHFESHLGLALLHEKQGRLREALASAEAYLRGAPEGTLQRGRAVRLAEDLKKRLDQQSAAPP